jgi:F-type H+-transporting ATPase subunit b
MSSLEEVLQLLLGAESEAQRKKQEALGEAESIIASTRRDFQQEREDRLAAAREQADTIVSAAEESVKSQVRQILAEGEEEARAMTERFEARSADLIGDLVEETARRILARGLR